MNEPYFKAVWFTPDGAGGGRAARVTLTPEGLLIDAGEGYRVEWPLRGLQFGKAGEEDAHLLVTCPLVPGPVGALTLTDRNFARILADRVGPEHQGLLSGFASENRGHIFRKWRNLVGATLLTAGVVIGGYWALSHWVADWAAKKLPLETERLWGDAMLRSLVAGNTEVTRGPAYEAAQAIFRRLKTGLPKDQSYTFTLHVVKDPMVNAFALPGGHMVLMTGLMAQAESPEEVAAVLAHEMAHVTERHVVKRLVQAMGWRIWFKVLFGTEDWAQVAFGLGTLLDISYGRGQEMEADLEGAKFLAGAGLPVGSMARFLDRISKEGDPDQVPAFLSTHPASKDRSEAMKKLTTELKPKNPRPLAIDWAEVKASLK
jgi:Zn-dependent protease with chaperone function